MAMSSSKRGNSRSGNSTGGTKRSSGGNSSGNSRAGGSSSSSSRSSSRRGTGRRELINTGTDKRYVRRDSQGQFKESDDVGRSLSADRKRKARTASKPGQGDRGDRKRS